MAAQLQKLLRFATSRPRNVTIIVAFALAGLLLIPGVPLASFVGIRLLTFAQEPVQEYEAEDALLSRGFLVATNHSSFSGSGFVDYVGEGYVEWTVEVAEGGKFLLSFRYALKYGDRPLDIRVNGTIASPNTPFPATGSWNSWGSVTREVALNSGTNTIRAQTRGRSGPNMDRLDVSVLPPSTE